MVKLLLRYQFSFINQHYFFLRIVNIKQYILIKNKHLDRIKIAKHNFAKKQNNFNEYSNDDCLRVALIFPDQLLYNIPHKNFIFMHYTYTTA